MKISEAFEGEDSTLREAFDEATDPLKGEHRGVIEMIRVEEREKMKKAILQKLKKEFDYYGNADECVEVSEIVRIAKDVLNKLK